jgi:glycosyltransferase involved in cell wall biosynthesis
MKDLLTIVIPSKNEGYGIFSTLHSLACQKHLMGVRVIIADSSTDTVSKELLTYFPKHLLDIKIIEGGLPSVARNNGAKLAKTPYILFLDADMVVTKPIQIYPEYDLVTCKVRTTDNYKYVYYVFDMIQRIAKYVSPFAVGGYMLWNREKFEELRGFNEMDKFAEDYHISMKVAPSKFHISSQVCMTSSRRFRNKGLWYMIRMMARSWWNRNNPEFFTDDYGYWK